MPSPETAGSASPSVAFDQRANELPKSAIKRVIHSAEAARSPALQVELGGEAIKQVQQPSLGFATGVGLIAAVVVLLLSFGSLLAMGLPILTALFGLGTGLGLIGLASRLVDMVDFSSDLALMIGLGVGIDYALFIVTRYRDAYRENGGDVQGALELAMNTAGRAILFAGATVVIALLGMPTLGVGYLYGVAIAASLAVLLVLAASLTLLPALLMLTGKRVGRSRPRRSRRPAARDGFWIRWVALIQRRPAWAALASTAILLMLAAPALGLRLGASDSGTDPAAQTTRKAYDLLAAGFGSGFNGPLQLAVRLPDAGDATTLTRLTTALRRTPGIASVAAPQLNPARDTAAIAVYPTTSPQSAQTTSLVKRLRDDVLPPLAKATGTTLYVGGATAIQVDFAHVLSGKLPLFIGVVVLLSALLLLIVFRSLLIPLQAAAMNLLSIAAALGVVQAIFERGWLGGLLGIQPGPIEAFIPADGLRDRLRALDGLRGLPRLPHPRGMATARRRERGRARGTRPHRPRHHRSRRGHGRRLRLLRHRRRPRAQALRDRAGNRRLPRRDRHPHDPPARRAGAARPPHLGLPQLVRPPAPAARDRTDTSGRADTRTGRGRLMTAQPIQHETEMQ